MFGKDRPKLERAIQGYLSVLRLEGRSPATQRYYRYVLLRLARHFPNRAATSLTRDELRRYFSILQGRVAQSSLNTYLVVVKRFLTWLVEEGEIDTNPLSNVHVRQVPWKPTKPFTKEEVDRLIKAAWTRSEKCVLYLLLNTGLRAGEVASLRVQDVGLKAGELAVTGKGNKARTVALNSMCTKALVGYLSANDNNGRLWPDDWDARKVGRILDRIGKRAGVTRIHPHLCRHTFCCYFLLETNDALALQQICGWSSLAMVQRYTAWVAAERAVRVHRHMCLVA